MRRVHLHHRSEFRGREFTFRSHESVDESVGLFESLTLRVLKPHQAWKQSDDIYTAAGWNNTTIGDPSDEHPPMRLDLVLVHLSHNGHRLHVGQRDHSLHVG